MKVTSLLKLLLLGAIWGLSFILMGEIRPTLGHFVVSTVRCLLAGLLLAGYLLISRGQMQWKQHAKHYLVVGLLQCGILFALFPYAIEVLPPPYAAILNTTSALFGVLLSGIFLKERITTQKILGVGLAIFGVAFVVRLGSSTLPGHIGWAVVACLVATLCYASAGIYVKKFAAHIPPVSLAGGSHLLSGLIFLPLAATYPPMHAITVHVALCALALAAICSAVAFLLFYNLIREIGPSKALSVGFLIPVFTMVWSFVFKTSVISGKMLLGAALTLLGVALVVLPPVLGFFRKTQRA